ncbi:hypothetical protein C8R47DRAFT_1240008 [Mycena vitilis]|nr:hypothetical protein C8R47DRAFT_1240008 [Mycena vitilis]
MHSNSSVLLDPPGASGGKYESAGAVGKVKHRSIGPDQDLMLNPPLLSPATIMALVSPSVADSVKILLAGLRSPMSHETGYLFAMFEACCAMHRSSAKPSSELIRAAMDFLLSARTTEAHCALVNRLLSCSCRVFDYGQSPPATLQPLECLDLFLDHLCGIVGEELRSLRPAKFRTRKPKRAARRQPWPNCVADIGLHDASCRDVLDTLLHWGSPAPVGSEIFALICRLARFWHPIGTEVFGSPGVVRHMRRTLLGAIRLYEFPLPPQSIDFFRRSVTACYTLAKGLVYVDAKLHSNHPYWSDGLHDIAVALVPRLAQRGRCLDEQRKWFELMLLQRGSVIFIPQNNSGNDDYFQARYEMLMGALRHKCMHLGCPIPLGTPVVTTLCSQCSVVSYCTAQCQRSAWNADVCPHKDICTLIAMLRDRLGMGRPSRCTTAKNSAIKEQKQADRVADEAWHQWVMRTPLEDMRAICREKDIPPRRCRAIWLYFLILNREKGTIPKRWEASWRAHPPMVPRIKFTTAYVEAFMDPKKESLTP